MFTTQSMVIVFSMLAASVSTKSIREADECLKKSFDGCAKGCMEKLPGNGNVLKACRENELYRASAAIKQCLFKEVKLDDGKPCFKNTAEILYGYPDFDVSVESDSSELVTPLQEFKSCFVDCVKEADGECSGDCGDVSSEDVQEGLEKCKNTDLSDVQKEVGFCLKAATYKGGS